MRIEPMRINCRRGPRFSPIFNNRYIYQYQRIAGNNFRKEYLQLYPREQTAAGLFAARRPKGKLVKRETKRGQREREKKDARRSVYTYTPRSGESNKTKYLKATGKTMEGVGIYTLQRGGRRFSSEILHSTDKKFIRSSEANSSSRSFLLHQPRE